MLILVQIALVFLLFLKLGSQQDRLDEVLSSTAQTNQSEPNAKPAALTTQDNIADGQPAQDRQRLRQIIREELAAALSDTGLMAQNAASTEQPPVYDQIEMQYQRELVLLQLDALKNQSEVSSGDLERLMGDIAKLEPKNRTELLKMLNQAMNRGDIKGNL